MADAIAFLRYFFLAFAAAGILGIFVIRSLRKRALSPAQLARWQAGPRSALPADQVGRLSKWQRNMRFVSIATLFYLGVMVGFSSSLPDEARVARWIAFLILPAMVIVGGVLQFSVRCPRCGMLLGLQSSLAVPESCERCGQGLRA